MLFLKELNGFYKQNKSMIVYSIILAVIVFLAVALKRKCIDKFTSIGNMDYKAYKKCKTCK